MKKEIKEPQTAMAKLMAFIDSLEAFLHPRVISALKPLVWDARTEMAQDAKDQKISRELQELEPWLERYRDDIKRYSAGGSNTKLLWQMRPLMAKIIEIYGQNTKTAKF